MGGRWGWPAWHAGPSQWPYDTGMEPADIYATIIRDAFADYHARFAEVSHRARRRFETRDWAAARTDAVERIELYDQCIAECCCDWRPRCRVAPTTMRCGR